MAYWTDEDEVLPLAIRDRLRDLLEADAGIVAHWATLAQVTALTIFPLPASGVAAGTWRLSLHWEGTPSGSSEAGLAMWRNMFVFTAEQWLGKEATGAQDSAARDEVTRLAWKVLQLLSARYLQEDAAMVPIGPTGRPVRLWDALRIDAGAPVPSPLKRTGDMASWRIEVQFVTESNCLSCD